MGFRRAALAGFGGTNRIKARTTALILNTFLTARASLTARQTWAVA